MKPIIVFVLATAAAGICTVAQANRINISVKNCESNHGAKVCVYHGGDNSRDIARRDKVLKKGATIDTGCQGQNTGGCYIRVIDRGYGCSAGDNDYHIGRNETVYMERKSKFKWKAHRNGCP
jgi:hypothetical protein